MDWSETFQGKRPTITSEAAELLWAFRIHFLDKQKLSPSPISAARKPKRTPSQSAPDGAPRDRDGNSSIWYANAVRAISMMYDGSVRPDSV